MARDWHGGQRRDPSYILPIVHETLALVYSQQICGLVTGTGKIRIKLKYAGLPPVLRLSSCTLDHFAHHSALLSAMNILTEHAEPYGSGQNMSKPIVVLQSQRHQGTTDSSSLFTAFMPASTALSTSKSFQGGLVYCLRAGNSFFKSSSKPTGKKIMH